MDDFVSGIRNIAMGLDQKQATIRIGIVSAYNPANHTAKVLLQPENVSTGWLPISSSMVGGGWGLKSPANPGQQAVVAFDSGDSQDGILIGMLHSNLNLPPSPGGNPVTSGEFAIMHSSGSFLHFHSDGSVTLNVNTIYNVTAGQTINMTAENINMVATNQIAATTPLLVVTGDILDQSSTNSVTAKGARLIYDNHTHQITSVMSGGATVTSHVPNQLE